MIALDTNILLRYLIDADSIEGPAAMALVEERLSQTDPGFVSIIVLAETLWVLKRGFRVSADGQRLIVTQLLNMPQIVVEHAEAVGQALTISHPDVADCILHEIGQAAGCTHTATFDKRFARLDSVELVK